MSNRPRLYRHVPLVKRDPWAAEFVDSGDYDELLRIVDKPAWERKMTRLEAERLANRAVSDGKPPIASVGRSSASFTAVPRATPDE